VFEVEALKRVASWVPSDSLVQVPHIHKFDKDVHAVIMDDAGEGSVTLKDFMKQGGPSVEMATQIGKGLGEFLGRVHAWGTEHRAECEIFQGHTEAKAIAGAYYYGQLVPFFSGSSWEPKLQDPPLVVDGATLAVLKEVAEETSKALVSANDHVRVAFSLNPPFR
jgi:5-methylthioribose kinase